MTVKSTETMGWDYVGDVVVAADAPGTLIALPALTGYRKFVLVTDEVAAITVDDADTTTGMVTDGVDVEALGPFPVGQSLYAYDAGGPTDVTLSVYATVNGDIDSLPIKSKLANAGYLQFNAVSENVPEDGDVLVFADASKTWAPSDALADAEQAILEIHRWDARDAELPTTNPAALATRNDRPVLAFDDSTDEFVIFQGIAPVYLDTSKNWFAQIIWAADTATAGDVRWEVRSEEDAEGDIDIDSDNFVGSAFILEDTQGTAGQLTYSIVNLGSLGIQPGEAFRIQIFRDTSEDTMTGDAQIVWVHLFLGDG
jgi:hypothetical protein